MSRVIIDISMSLDGFITAAQQTADEPMGRGGEVLHEWVLKGTDEERAMLSDAIEAEGAILVGRKTYNDSIPWWGADGPVPSIRRTTVVVTHTPPENVPENSVYRFVSGIEGAVQMAKEIAGSGHVGVGGGASIIRQLIEQGLADGLLLHVVPVIFGQGLRLFDALPDRHIRLVPRGITSTSAAYHMRYDFERV